MSQKSERAIIVRMIAILVFIYYMYVLLKHSIFTRILSGHAMRGLELIPFQNTSALGSLFKASTWTNADALTPVAGHIVFFLPLGFILPFLDKRTKTYLPILGVAAAISFSIEILQYLTKSGITSTDHLLLNLFGATLGYLLYKALRYAYMNS
ncbi:MAG: VanZ family protein [Tissierellia bacterium]|nr:VanZ family protein [Tissierellia bacterium]